MDAGFGGSNLRISLLRRHLYSSDLISQDGTISKHSPSRSSKQDSRFKLVIFILNCDRIAVGVRTVGVMMRL